MHALTYATEPPRILYRGAYLPLSPLQVRIMETLLKGPARARALHANQDSLKVIICHMRKKLPDGVRIVAVREWGYELRVDGWPARQDSNLQPRA